VTVDPSSVRRFEYRPCRILTGFDIDFVSGGETFHGRCTDVSDAGIRATLDGSVQVLDSGLLILRHPAGVLEVEAQVAYIDNRQVGLVFLFDTPWECALTIEYMTSIANREAHSRDRSFSWER
jgi:hypothetical protein